MDYKKKVRKLANKAARIHIRNSIKEKLYKHRNLILTIGIEFMIAAVISGILLIMEVMIDLGVM
ncbi:MAG: hypothetical protein HDR12_06355 [Lachnospiraceae bacterium]|nr:hypothetical protein [Lachnospiraceae bacterium]